MLSEKRYVYEDRERPWTVPALIALSLLSWLVSVVFDFSYGADGDSGPRFLLKVVLSLLFYWGLWTGRRWAYVFTVIATLFTAVVSVPYLLSDRAEVAEGLWLVITLIIQLYLLFHPLTRAYFKEHESLTTSGDQAEASRSMDP